MTLLFTSRSIVTSMLLALGVLLGFCATSQPAGATDCSGSENCPSQLSAHAGGATEVVLSWVDPSTPPDHFSVSRKTAKSNFAYLGERSTTNPDDANGYTDFTAKGGTAYVYEVCAVYSASDQECVLSGTVTTPPADTESNYPKPDILIGRVSSTYAKFVWSSSKTYDLYNVKMGPTGQQVGQIEIDSKGNNGWYQWAALTPKTDYTFEVEGCTRAWTSTCSKWAVATISTPASDAPVQTDPPPGNLRATAKSTSEIDLSWQPPAAASGFELSASDGRVFYPGADSRGIAIPGLATHTAYTFQVCSVYNNDRSRVQSRQCANAGATTRAEVMAPTSVAARVQRPGVNVTWNRPADSDDQWFEVQSFQTPTGPLELHVPRVAKWTGVSGRLNTARRSYAGTFAGGQVRVCTGNETKTVCSAPVNTQGSRTEPGIPQ